MIAEAPSVPRRRRRGAALAAVAALLAAGVAPAQESPAQVSPAEEPAAQEARAIPTHPSRLRLPAREIRVPRAEPATHRLSTGTRVVIVEDHTLPLVDVTVALLGGAFLDPPGKPGLAELTGAMVRRGGTAKRSPDDFDEAVDFLGTEIDTRAGPTRAGASLDCLTETLEESLALFFEMLGHPGFETGRLEGIESNLLAGFLARNDDPIAVMEREWSWLLVGTEHHLGRQLTGADLAAIERKDLVEFHGRYWRPERAVLAVSGDVRAERVLPLLEAGIARWRESLPPEGAAPPWPPPGLPREAAPGIYLAGHVSGQDSGQASGQDSSQRSSQASPQAKVSVGHGLEPIRDWLSRDAAALEAANEILGGTRGQMSRINGRLRGQGLVYRALSELDTGVYEPGSFRIFLDASPESVLGAVETCLAELDRLISTGVAAAELDAVREELLSGLTLRFDTAQETAGYFAEDLLLGRPHEYWYGYEKRLLALEPRDLQAAAARHLDPEKLKVLVVGGEESPAPSGARDPRLTRWLGRPHRLPARDPVTLEPLAAPARAGC